MIGDKHSLIAGAARPFGMKPIFEDANNMPNIGEHVYVTNSVTVKYEYLKFVFINQDDSLI